jgi:hypothetical protein
VSVYYDTVKSRRYYGMVFKSKIMYGIEVWKGLYRVHGRFQKLMEIPNCATSGFDEMELGGKSRRGMLVRETGSSTGTRLCVWIWKIGKTM